jgi:hypothetical protein
MQRVEHTFRLGLLGLDSDRGLSSQRQAESGADGDKRLNLHGHGL